MWPLAEARAVVGAAATHARLGSTSLWRYGGAKPPNYTLHRTPPVAPLPVSPVSSGVSNFGLIFSKDSDE